MVNRPPYPAAHPARRGDEETATIDSCAALSRRHAEPLAGTAPRALGWLALEQPGAWGRDPLLASRLDPAVGGALTQRVADLPVRVQVLRQVGPERRDAGRRVLLAHAGARPWLEELTLDDPREVLDLDPTVCTRPDPPGIGVASPAPRFLVCTHAKRDRCCASLGRPVVDTLAALHPDLVWETSHVGGHRFAAVMAVLPHGLVYGGLDVEAAAEVAASHLDGRLAVTFLRGRSSLEKVEQAAEVHLRAHLGRDDLGRPDVLGVEVADDRAEVRLAVDGSPWRVRLAREAPTVARRLSCGSDGPELPPAAWVEVAVVPG